MQAALRFAVAGAVMACGTPGATPTAVTPAPSAPAPTADAPRTSDASPGAAAAVPGETVPLGRLPGDVIPVQESLALEIDPEAERFSGTADLVIRAPSPTTRVWLHGRGLTVTAATVALPNGGRLVARYEEVDPTGVARVTLPSPVQGSVVLHLAFHAPYDPSLVGVYRVKTAAGAAVFSKFEAIYARRAFPCFDEPAIKIPYTVTLTVPRGMTAIGNMPVVDESFAGPTSTRIRFAATPPLPSYLVAFAVGPLDTRTVTMPPGPGRAAPLKVGAVTARGRIPNAAYALREAEAVIVDQERYFGIGFPYPKVDLIAAPDFQSGAMENAGAIVFRDSRLLVDDAVASAANRVAVTEVIAHELAHQWFGDLVTMPWWDDLWLNEGFATFLATRTLRSVRPEFEAELAAANDTNKVMSVDSLASARRIRQPILTTHDITNAFDGITYDKGAAVLAMLEHFIGDEPFRRGLRAHLNAHLHGNATTAELIAALSTAAGRDLGPLVASFLDQPGVPTIAMRATCAAGRGAVELAQRRWTAAGAPAAAPQAWTIPVCVRAGIGQRVEQACAVLDAPTGTLALPGCADWIYPNADAAGYYRASLAADDLARLRDRGVRRLSVVERLRLAHDVDAAFRSGALPAGDVLRTFEQLARDPHGAVALVPLPLLDWIDDFVVDPPSRARLRARIARQYAPALSQLGWRPPTTDRPWRRLFRAKLIEFLALRIEDPAVQAEAARVGRRWLGVEIDRVRHPDAVSPDLLETALVAAVRKGGAPVFEAALGQLATASDSELRQRLLVALAGARDPSLLGRALDLALDPALRGNERLIVLREALMDTATRDVAWAWVKARFDALAPLLPDRYGARIPEMVAMCDAQRAEDVRAFFAPRADKLTGGPRLLALALESAAQCEARLAAQRDGVLAYLR